MSEIRSCPKLGTLTLYRKSFQPRDGWRNIAPMPLGLFVQKLQPKVGLAGYDILFVYFVVEAKSSKVQKAEKNISRK